MRRRLLVLLALAVLGALVVAVPATATAKPATGKAKCTLKKKAKCKKANLAKQKIGKLDLAGADLSGANLAGAKLTGTNLAGANLARANLTGAVLRNVDLRGADLQRADLRRAKLIGVRLSPPAAGRVSWDVQVHCLMDLKILPGSGVVGLEEAQCKGADLRKVRFYGVSIMSSDLRGANLEGANLEDAYIADSRFDGASLGRADLEDATITKSNFTLASLAEVACKYCKIGTSTFDSAYMTGFSPATAVTSKTGDEANSYVDAIGLGSSSKLTLAGSLPTGATATVSATRNWPWSKSCSALPCETTIDAGTALVVEVTGATAASSNAAVVCTASDGKTTCSGTPGADTTIAIGAPLKTVSVRVVNASQQETVVPRITISLMSAAGVVESSHACTSTATCSASFPSGSWVSVQMDYSGLGSLNSMRCPTGSAESNDYVSFVSSCSAFALTADTAIVPELF